MPPPAHPVITIVGGGFAGTALALHLRQQGALAQAEIHLIEPREVPGPGLAYSVQRPEYLLNVRPAGLSIYANAPGHFAAWLRRQPESASGIPSFAARASYGRYLHQELAAALALSHGRLQWHQTSASAAEPRPDGRCTVQLANGAALVSDFVVLALGNFPPPPPVRPAQLYQHHPAYHADPWAPRSLRHIGPDDSVLLIGSGLTAVDVLLALHQDGHRAPVAVVARHGRWPAAHSSAGTGYPTFSAELAAETTMAGVVRVFKRHLRAARAQGIDWRAVVDALRPDLGRIWAAWPLAEQSRFLRHLAGRWSVARHRSPPQNAAKLAELVSAGLVQLHTGTVRGIVPHGDALQVLVHHSTTGPGQHTAQHVICCAGPLLDYSRIADPLVVGLREAGHLCPDPLQLGLLTDEHGALRNAAGQVSRTLFTLGPSRRPAYFESTAVPELRQQAAALAAEIARRTAEATC